MINFRISFLITIFYIFYQNYGLDSTFIIVGDKLNYKDDILSIQKNETIKKNSTISTNYNDSNKETNDKESVEAESNSEETIISELKEGFLTIFLIFQYKPFVQFSPFSYRSSNFAIAKDLLFLLFFVSVL